MKFKALTPASEIESNPFFIHHWTAEGRDVGSMSLAL